MRSSLSRRAETFYRVKGDIITRKQWRLAALAGIVAVAILIALWFRGRGPAFDWAVFAAAFSGLDWSWLALAFVLSYATYFGRALRWAVFLRPLRARPRIWNLVKATIIGFTALILLGLPGEFIRPYLISVKEEAPLTSPLEARC